MNNQIKEKNEGREQNERCCKNNNPLVDTVYGMLSLDYRERFKAEYAQTKIRWEKLKNFCNRIEAAEMMNKEEPKHDCPVWLLREQQKIMGEYLHMLEMRAVIENIELEE